jgi:hypothetical protein
MVAAIVPGAVMMVVVAVVMALVMAVAMAVAAVVVAVAQVVSAVVMAVVGSEKNSVVDPGCLSRIPDPDFYPSRNPDLGSRIQKQQQKRGVKKNLLSYLFR